MSATSAARQSGAKVRPGSFVNTWRPVIFREGDLPLIDLFVMMREADLPSHMRDRTWTEPALVIRCADGRIHPEYAAVKLAVGFPP